MTAGSWIYIGTQGILQGTYETFAAVGKKHFNSDLSGKIVVTSGLGGMGGAQPLSITMNNGIAICIDIDEHRINRRLQTGYLNKKANNIDNPGNHENPPTPMSHWGKRHVLLMPVGQCFLWIHWIHGGV